ncbi:MAG: transposase, partial [Methanosarcinales archaeon]|nr:transposase [Methanosarcinales archaeon]
MLKLEKNLSHVPFWSLVKNTSKLLTWVHILISNIKGNSRGTYHRVSSKHLSRYLSEFCYRFNRRFRESQM